MSKIADLMVRVGPACITIKKILESSLGVKPRQEGSKRGGFDEFFGTWTEADLAVLSDRNSLCGRKLDILAELAKNGFCNVDLVILPGDDVVLQYEAVRLNRIVYQRPDFDSASIFSLFVRRYLDFLHYLKVQREAYKQRVLNGQA